MRIGLVMPLALKRGGCENQLINLLRANTQGPGVGYHVCFLEDGPMLDEVRGLGYPVTLINAGRLRFAHRYVASVLRLARWMRRQRLTQVISWMEKGHLYAGPAGVLAGVPTAWWIRSIDPRARMLRLLHRLPANRVFACSRAALEASGRPDIFDYGTVLHSAVDLDRFSAERLPPVAAARHALGIPPGGPVVAMIGRLQRWKGFDVFLDAAAMIVAVRPDAQFLAIGGDHALEPGVRAELEAQTRRLNLEANVRFTGYQPDVPLWMHAADVIVHASTSPEPLGVVIIEAMVLGKTVVAARAAGPLEIITDGVDGLFTEPGNAGALADAILRTLEATSANADLRARAKARGQTFGAAAFAERLARCLRDLAEHPGRIRRSLTGRPRAATGDDALRVDSR